MATLIYNKCSAEEQVGKDGLFNMRCWANCLYGKKINPELLPCTYTKINSRWTVRCQYERCSDKLIEYDRWGYFHNLGIENAFWRKNKKASTSEEKTDKLKYINMKNVAHRNTKGMKKQVTELEKVSIRSITANGHIHRI